MNKWIVARVIVFQVPEYYEIVKNPIDLTKIKTKLQTLNYDSVYDFVDDMKLLFDNCYLFNQVCEPHYFT